jgi:hypothetical protein
VNHMILTECPPPLVSLQGVHYSNTSLESCLEPWVSRCHPSHRAGIVVDDLVCTLLDSSGQPKVHFQTHNAELQIGLHCAGPHHLGPGNSF